MPAAKTKKKTKKVKKWNEQHKAVAHLMEKELSGLLDYLRTLHRNAIILVIGCMALIVFALHVLFQTEQMAVVGFLTLIATCLVTIVFALWSLRPWVLPRFLLPIDLSSLEPEQLMELFRHPEEYIELLKNHIEVLTDSFLIPKLNRFRNAIIVLTFGISISILLSIALP